tara:strand:+ start:156 stop:356 length:201 start_codon:yes stop_codon:yes gene_type:complete
MVRNKWNLTLVKNKEVKVNKVNHVCVSDVQQKTINNGVIKKEKKKILTTVAKGEMKRKKREKKKRK